MMTNRNPDSLRKQRFKARLSVQHENSLHSRLRQHLPAAFNERWTRRHWIHAGLFASIGLMVATIIPGFLAAGRSRRLHPGQPAFGIAGTGTDPV
jgi:hypothetical protein